MSVQDPREVRVGQVYVAARTRSNPPRRWRVTDKRPCELWWLWPIGGDGGGSGPGGQLSGGVRSIERGTEELLDPKRWTLVAEPAR